MAQRYLNSRLREHERERELEGTEILCTEYLDRWLQMAAKPTLRTKSYRDYEAMLRRYVRPTLGERVLRGITSLDLQSIYQDMHDRGLSPRTIRYTHAVVRAALNQAVKWRLLPESPATGVALPKSSRSEMRVMTAEEVRCFLQYALTTSYGVPFAVAVTTGMRPSEYLGLRWTDIDWNTGTATVSRTLQKGGGGWSFAATKRERSRRVVKLQTWVVDLLRRTQLTQSAGSPSGSAGAGQIFRTNAGEPINSDYLARQFKNILRRAGLPTMRLYDLRHTAATLALAAGVQPKVVSEQLGHASAAFTLDVYSHVLPHMQAGAARRVEALLFPQEQRCARPVDAGT
jgi:integrase